MSDPAVSVIMGAHNCARFVGIAIGTVFAQAFSDHELIVVDDASSDNTADVVRRAAGDRAVFRVRVLNSALPAIPRNEAIAAAKGRYIAFLDADDLWYPQKLQKQIAFMEAYPECGLSHSYCHVVDEDGKVLTIRHEGRLPPSGRCFHELLRHCFISISSVVVRRSVLDDVGLFNEDPFYRAREDYDLFLRIAREYEVGLLPDVLAAYRRSPQGISQQDDRWPCRPEDVPFHEVVLRRRDLWSGVTTRAEVLRILLNACRENSQHWRDRRCRGRAAWFALRALRHAPFNGGAWADLAKSVA